MKTKKEYEQYLNESSQSITIEDAKELFGYMADNKVIERAWHNKRLGSLARKHDSIEFNDSFQDYKNISEVFK